MSPQAQAFVTPFSMQSLPIDLLDAFIGSSWVPQCAMKVQRLTEMGEFHTDHPGGCGNHLRHRHLQKFGDGFALTVEVKDAIARHKPVY